MMTGRSRAMTHNPSGFTLLEVMVALLISAISLLGLAALQVSARNSLDASFQYSQASLIAQDLSERMHANPAGVRAGFYNGIDTENGAPASIVCTDGCTPAAIADNDIAAWTDKVQDDKLLSLGIGRTLLNGDRVAITVMWNGRKRRFDQKPDSCDQLDCLTIEVPVP